MDKETRTPQEAWQEFVNLPDLRQRLQHAGMINMIEKLQNADNQHEAEIANFDHQRAQDEARHIREVRELTTPASAAVPLAVTAGTATPAWSLSAPKRYQGYRRPLYVILKAAHVANRPCPTAREVLDAFKKAKPDEVISVMPDGMNYYDANGNSKSATLDSIAKAISRLTK